MTVKQEHPNAKAVATQWFSALSEAISLGEVKDIVEGFLPHGWFRDVLTFTWDYRALEGSEKISQYLSEHLRAGAIFDLKLVENDVYRAPRYVAKTGIVEAVFTFETDLALGQGHVKLERDDTGAWKALNVCMIIMELKGHEEPSHELGIYGGHTLAWEDVYRERRAKVEADPHVLISK